MLLRLAVNWGRSAIALWVAALGLGFATLWRYEVTAGAAGGPPDRWPSASAIERPPGRPALLMFAHPQCVCTRASLTELERLQGRLEGRLAVYVVFLRPADAGPDWDQSDLWKRAAAMPGVTVVRDLDGLEAVRFGAATSGHTLVYDAQGRLLFSGGLTAARGREGAAPGAQRIAALLATGRADRNDSPVFGCALRHEVAVANQPSAKVGGKEVGDEQ
jgi:hypothetical protein